MNFSVSCTFRVKNDGVMESPQYIKNNGARVFRLKYIFVFKVRVLCFLNFITKATRISRPYEALQSFLQPNYVASPNTLHAITHACLIIFRIRQLSYPTTISNLVTLAKTFHSWIETCWQNVLAHFSQSYILLFLK